MINVLGKYSVKRPVRRACYTLPDSDFDPTETGVPWCTMRDHGHHIVFATLSGRTARADPKMVTGEGLGILSPLLKADANGRSAYLYMEQSDAFQRPISYGGLERQILMRCS